MSQKQCPTCFGMGMLEHFRCHGSGCDGCIEGEIICPKCNGFGIVDASSAKATNDLPVDDEDLDLNQEDLEEEEEEDDDEQDS